MRPLHQDPVVNRLTRFYRALLALYPADHRNRFGVEMERHFRDLVRDTLKGDGGGSAIFTLGCRTAWDFCRTCPAEHWRGTCHQLRMKTFPHPGRTAFAVGLLVASAVLIFRVSALLATPRLYRSVCRLTFDDLPAPAVAVATTFQPVLASIASDQVLQRVAKELGLAAVWSARSKREVPFTAPEAVEHLRTRLVVRTIPLTRIVDVSVLDADPQLAAQIANGICHAYLQIRTGAISTSVPAARLIDPAFPSRRAVRPNTVLFLALGILVGGVTGVATGLIMLGFLRPRAASPNLSSTIPS